ncbi:hypothetical protein [Sinomicrobium weinanense]|uniref:Uncharacterized protein n=1 Tax=Sinomicrobium weinanense TaxID=2842200 RepID=A0A926Q2G7_9FLAO|nr:hypothetical protein [Sinomicrobium weinanense]MBC9795834.1 hypothetical protein [Sinomicrobium weinanense]MBU3125354.1 hypothetical protein [Sinomicrobium weinanense]
MRKYLIIFLVSLMMVNCMNDCNTIREDLMIEIKKYIEYCEKRADSLEIATETDIYYVNFSIKEDKKFVDIFQECYYNKEYMDGYITIEENKVFFYNSFDSLVDVKCLDTAELLGVPDENSKAAETGFNPVVWTYLVKKDELIRIYEEE